MGLYTPPYIGQTHALDTRFDDDTTWRCVNVHFVNAIGIHFEKDTETRMQMVRDLIEAQQPICRETDNQ